MAQTKSTEQREVEQFATYIQKKGVNKRNKNAVIKAVDSFVAAESPFTSTAELKSRVSKLYDSGAFGSFENQSGLPSGNTRGAGFGAMDYDSAVAALGTFPKDRVPRLKDLMEKDTSKTKTQTAKPNSKVDLLHELTVTNKMIAEGKMKPGFAKTQKTERNGAAVIPSVLDYKGNKTSSRIGSIRAGGMEEKDVEIEAVAGSKADQGSPTNPTTADQSAKEFVSEILNGEITNSIVKSILESPQYKKAFESILQQTLPNDVAKAREILEQYVMDNPVPQDENEQGSSTGKPNVQMLNEVPTINTRLKNPDPIKITDADGKTTYYGGSQGWVLDKSLTDYLGGCPPTAAANLLLYMAQSDPELAKLYGYDINNVTKDEFTKYMVELYNYVRPLEVPGYSDWIDNKYKKGELKPESKIITPTLGVFLLDSFINGIEKFARTKGIELKANKQWLSTYDDFKNYIREGLEKDCPVSFFNLMNPVDMPYYDIDQKMDRLGTFDNHWVIITGMTEDPRTGDVKLEVSTWGGKGTIDLKSLFKISPRTGKLICNSIKAVYFTKI